MLKRAYFVSAVLLAAGCSEMTNSEVTTVLAGLTDETAIKPASPAAQPRPVISDARTDGDESLYFLWPIVPERAPRDQPFDPYAAPSVSVCRVVNDSCVETVAKLAYSDRPGTPLSTVRQWSSFEFYLATWVTPRNGVGERYRVSVSADGLTLGYVDVQLVNVVGDLRSVPDDVVGVVAGWPLPIPFRIEQTPFKQSAEIGPAGGRLDLPGIASLIVPSGAFPDPTVIRLSYVTAPAPPPVFSVSAPLFETVPRGSFDVVLRYKAGAELTAPVQIALDPALTGDPFLRVPSAESDGEVLRYMPVASEAVGGPVSLTLGSPAFGRSTDGMWEETRLTLGTLPPAPSARALGTFAAPLVGPLPTCSAPGARRPLLGPLPSTHAVVGSYGLVRNNGTKSHFGIDIDGAVGDTVYAAEEGTASWSWHPFVTTVNYGDAITIVHPDGTRTFYAHLLPADPADPAQGPAGALSGTPAGAQTSVRKGQPIAQVGVSGRMPPYSPLGPHLHFEYVDPQFIGPSIPPQLSGSRTPFFNQTVNPEGCRQFIDHFGFSPSPLALTVGELEDLTVSAFDANDNEIEDLFYQWWTNDPLVATLSFLPPLSPSSATTTVTGVSTGMTSVAASAGGETGSVPVSVSGGITLRLYSIDDVLDAFVTNSTHNRVRVLSGSYQQDTGPVDISSYLMSGEANLIEVELTNFLGGWTYGYDLRVNGSTVWSGQCGQTGSFGCQNDDHTLGIVFSDQYTLVLP